MTNVNGAATVGTYQREPKKPPAAPSAGAKDVDFGSMSIKGGRGYRFSFKSGTWGDTAVKVRTHKRFPFIHGGPMCSVISSGRLQALGVLTKCSGTAQQTAVLTCQLYR